MISLIRVSFIDINLKTSHKSVAEPGVFNKRTQSRPLATDLNRCHLPPILIMCSLVLGQILTLCFLFSLTSKCTLSKKHAHSTSSPVHSIRLLPNPLIAYNTQPFLPRNMLLFVYAKNMATASPKSL